jgi:LPXTG-motif cell wall-anchored protein
VPADPSATAADAAGDDAVDLSIGQARKLRDDTGDDDGAPLALIGVAVLSALTVAGAAVVAWRRRPST